VTSTINYYDGDESYEHNKKYTVDESVGSHRSPIFCTSKAGRRLIAQEKER